MGIENDTRQLKRGKPTPKGNAPRKRRYRKRYPPNKRGSTTQEERLTQPQVSKTIPDTQWKRTQTNTGIENHTRKSRGGHTLALIGIENDTRQSMGYTRSIMGIENDTQNTMLRLFHQKSFHRTHRYRKRYPEIKGGTHSSKHGYRKQYPVINDGTHSRTHRYRKRYPELLRVRAFLYF